MTTMHKIDRHLWNEQSAIVRELFADIDEQHPDIDEWYEVKSDRFAMMKAGATVIEAHGHAWLGCPRNRDIYVYIDILLE